MRDYSFLRSNDGVIFEEVTAGTGTNLANGQRQEIEFPAVASRYWRLQMSTNYGYHHLLTAQYVEFRSCASTVDDRLTAYWDAGGCGPHGNDHNARTWCGGVGSDTNGVDPHEHCREQVGVEQDICPTGVATLQSIQGTGRFTSVTIDGCAYAYYAQYACSDEPSYNWGAMHTNSCPGGSAISEADCLAAVQGLLGSGQSQGRSHLVAGSWRHVPTGCSAQTHFTHGRNGDFAAHYNRNANGNNDGGYTPVCSTTCQHLANQDVVSGTFSHLAGDGRNNQQPSDEACSASCTTNAACTAWVRQPSTGNCWLSQQAVVTFEADSDRTTGLRCK